MVEAWTAAQIREAERPHLEAGEPLMRRAADGLAEAVRDLLRASSGSRDGRAARVLVLVGSGNNGGDALYAGESLARDVVPRGGTITVVPVGSRVHEAALAAALDAGATFDSVGCWCDPAGVAGRLPGYDVVLDGLVGTGSSGTGLRGDALRVVRAMLPVFEQARAGDREAHRAGAESGHVARSDVDSDVTGIAGVASRVPVVVAVDVPSGIGVDDGTVPDPPVVLSADMTVTFGGRKVGLLIGPGSRMAGRVLLVDIGIGPDLARMTPFDADPAA